MRGFVPVLASLAVLAGSNSADQAIYVDASATPAEASAAIAFAERYSPREYRNPTYLYVREPLVDDAGLAPMAHLTKVERLELVGLPISDHALAYLTPLVELRSLQIVGSRPYHGNYESYSDEIYSTISGTGFKHLANLDKVQNLYLHRLRLNANVLSALRELDSLESLSLSDLDSAAEPALRGAGVSDLALRDLRDLLHLKRVSLSTTGPAATGVGFRDWKSADQIEDLTLRGFHVREPGWRAISEFSKLRRLVYVSASRGFANRRPATFDAAFVDWKVLGSLAHLESLYIDGITNRAVEGIAECKQLQKLQLGGEGFSDDGLNRICGLSELVELNLEYTEVTGLGFVSPEGFPNLKVVRLKESNVNDAGLERISELPALEWLDIESTNVTPEGLVALVKCKSTLKYLRPPLTVWEYWTPEHKVWVTAVEKLKAEMPDLEVYFVGDAPP